MMKTKRFDGGNSTSRTKCFNSWSDKKDGFELLSVGGGDPPETKNKFAKVRARNL